MSSSETVQDKRVLFFLFTCVKDGRQYISKLLNSLLEQTATNFVHYIYDDGSIDPVEDLVTEYKKRAANLINPYVVIYEKNPVNLGLNMATKHCIDLCDKPYFIWIDCDNWVDKDFFSQLEKTIAENQKAIVIRTAFTMFDPLSGKITKYDSLEDKKNLFTKNQTKNFFFRRFIYSFFAVKKDLYLQINPNNYFILDRNCFNDTQVLCHCIYSKKDFAYSDGSVGYYLLNRDGEGYSHKDDVGTTYPKMIKILADNDNAWCKDFIEYVPEIRKIYNLMEMSYSKKIISDANSWYKELLRLKKRYKIPSYLSFGYGNKFTWKLRLWFLKMRNLLINRKG